MSDMKCPFCQQELKKRHAATTDYNSMFITYYCGNPECESTTDLIGCKEFWDILGQLIRTRKALDVAVDALKTIKFRNETYNRDDSPDCIDATLALEQITALEQKNHFANASKKVEQKKSAFVHNKIEFPEFNDNLLEEFDKQFFENGQDDDLTETALEQKE